MRPHPSLLSLLLILSCSFLYGQDAPYRNIYITGNTDGMDVKSVFMNDLLNRIDSDKIPSSLFFLGDFSTKKELKKSFTKRLKNLKEDKGLQISFIPGDKEWNKLSESGSSYVKTIEKNIEDKLKKVFTPNDGCPGPHEKKIDDNTVLISINTSWFLTAHNKPEGFSSTCALLFESEFWEELEDLIEDNEGKNIIIAGHHPVYSNGYYAGKGVRSIEWLPILGSMFYAYRNYDGSADYLSNKRYQHFRDGMERVMNKFQGLIYLSGHEHSIELQNIKGNLHVNSGAAKFIRKGSQNESSLFTQYNKGYTCLSFYKDGRVKAKVFNTDYKNKTNSYVDYVMISPCGEHVANNKIPNIQFSDCYGSQKQENVPIPTNKQNEIAQGLGQTVPGIEYKAGNFKSKWMGNNYRNEWTTKINIPYLDLKNEKGGLTAFGKGGGKQTNSLKLINKRKEQFAFRSVNKNTGRDPYDPFKNTIVTTYTQELISNQLPFGDILVSKLLDNTDILHMRPRAFLMPDDPALGKYREDFAMVLGTLEERPKGKKGIRPGFGNADIVVSSNQMYRYLLHDNSNSIDGLAFAKAVLFDAWVGDWDKHGDNWKWAGFKHDAHYHFKPIPKDRDHVFAIYEGIIPAIAKNFVPFYAHFDEDLSDLKSLTYQGRHMLNFINSKLTLEDWIEAAKYLQSKFNPQNIDQAFDAMPLEIKSISKDRIKKNLISRLGKLESAAHEVYNIYNRIGLIVGSNEKEKFAVTRKLDGSVSVVVSKINSSEPISEKVFYPNFTKEIQLYGLGKDDEFIILGESKETISIRIIGGKGEDVIRDLAKIKSNKIVTTIYDKYEKDKFESSSNTKVKKEFQDPDFKITAFEYNSFIPLAIPSYTSDWGFYFLGLYDFKNHGFNKPDFQHHLKGNFSWVPGLDNFKIKGKYLYRQFWGNQNLLARYTLAINDLGFDDFFGISNKTRENASLEDLEYYDMRNTNYRLLVGVNNYFFNKSDYEIGIGIQHYNIKAANTSSSIFGSEKYQDVFGLGKTWNGFLDAKADLNFLDNHAFPLNGARLEIQNTIYRMLNENNGFHGIAKFSLIEYYSFELIKQATLAIKIGGSYNYGETPFYHLSSLGNSNNLRTHASNIFLGEGSTYANFQLRHSVGTMQNKILPFNYGLLFFYDTGRVFNDESFSFDDWNYGYGVGMYTSFLKGLYNFHLSVGKNQYDKRFIRFGLGLGLE